MNPIRIISVALIGLLVGGAIGFGFKMFTDAETPEVETAASIPEGVLQKIPDFSYPDTNGRLRHGKEWQAKILVLNFWAAWCPPCREETPAFVHMQEKYQPQNVKFVGIAIDDPEPVQDFMDTYGVNYPVLMGDINAVTLSRRLGNRFEGLPYTVVAEPGGKIVLRHSGGLTTEQLEPLLKKLVAADERTSKPAPQI